MPSIPSILRADAPAAPRTARLRFATPLALLALGACSDSTSDGIVGNALPPIKASSIAGRLMVGPVAGSGGALLEQEPNNTPNQVQFVGDISPGFSYMITGDITDEGTDPFDGFRFRATGSVELRIELQMLNETTDLDIGIFDAVTGDELCSLTNITNPEVGDCSIGTGVAEFDIAVYSFTGASAYVLRVEADAPAAASTGEGEDLPPSSGNTAKPTDWIARYLGAEHPMTDGRVVVLETTQAFGSDQRKLFTDAEGLELVSRSADGTSVYRLDPQEAAGLAKGSPGAWAASLEHQVARKAFAFSRRPGVRAASPDYILRTTDTPSDTHYPLQWHYPQVRLPFAWERELGSEEVTVGVIDTGVTDHPDLLPRLVPGYDFVSDPSVSNDGDGMDPDPTDPGDGAGAQPATWHGTHVSGTIGSATNNQEGVAGVDWRCKVMGLRALGIGGGTISDISAAIRYAAGLDNASGALPPKAVDVINMSLGGPGFSTVLEAACNDAFNAGVVLVASAGNQPDTVPKYPAAYTSVIAVGAVRYDTQLAPYSSHGSWLDLVAPGGDLNVDQNGDGFPDGVLSTHKDENGLFNFSFQQGTSMASPHVAGILALLISSKPDSTPTELRTLLRATAQDLGEPGVDELYGFGLVDALAALNAQNGGGPTGPLLAVNPTSVNFGVFDTFFPVTLANIGGDVLEVLDVEVQYASGDGWLQAGLTSSSVLTNISHGFLDLSVDRSNSMLGTYAATVIVRSVGLPDQPVQVLMTVGGGERPDHPTFVLVLDAETYETVEQVTTDLATDYGWALGPLAAGRYLIVAGTDLDEDGLIGDEGEPLFGLWPSALDPTVIRIEEPAQIEGIEFPVSTLGSIGSLSLNGQSGFARLR